jgi:GT2 family glycosyltransferase
MNLTTSGSSFVSVVLPAYYSHETLAISLDALGRQTFRDFEIIVVNSSPEEETRAVLANYPEVTFIQSPQRLYPHAARNAGFERARGSLFVCSDPDVAAHPDWLQHIVAAHLRGAQAGGGSMGLLRNTWWECGVHLAKFHELLPGLPAGTRAIVPTANAFYSRDLWKRIGPFPTDIFAGDAVMSWRATQAGHPPVFLPSARVDHIHGGNWSQLWRERTRRGLEFLEVRARFENWSQTRLLFYAFLSPFSVLSVLLRTAAAAARCGWLARYIATLPVQAWAQVAWAFGEVHAVFGPKGVRR